MAICFWGFEERSQITISSDYFFSELADNQNLCQGFCQWSVLFEMTSLESVSTRHTSLKSKLAKNDFPEEKTIYSESSQPGDFKNDLEIGLAYNVALNMY